MSERVGYALGHCTLICFFPFFLDRLTFALSLPSPVTQIPSSHFTYIPSSPLTLSLPSYFLISPPYPKANQQRLKLKNKQYKHSGSSQKKTFSNHHVYFEKLYLRNTCPNKGSLTSVILVRVGCFISCLFVSWCLGPGFLFVRVIAAPKRCCDCCIHLYIEEYMILERVLLCFIHFTRASLSAQHQHQLV